MFVCKIDVENKNKKNILNIFETLHLSWPYTFDCDRQPDTTWKRNSSSSFNEMTPTITTAPTTELYTTSTHIYLFKWKINEPVSFSLPDALFLLAVAFCFNVVFVRTLEKWDEDDDVTFKFIYYLCAYILILTDIRNVTRFVHKINSESSQQQEERSWLITTRFRIRPNRINLYS